MNSPQQAAQFADAHIKTMRAVKVGVAISMMDGPVPVMDWVGLAVTTGMSMMAWYEYYSS
jgi:hypothetical protein